jgi:hypothetical protein
MRTTWWHESSTVATCTVLSTGSEPANSSGPLVSLPTRKMEPTEVNANRVAPLPGGRISLG